MKSFKSKKSPYITIGFENVETINLKRNKDIYLSITDISQNENIFIINDKASHSKTKSSTNVTLNIPIKMINSFKKWNGGANWSKEKVTPLDRLLQYNDITSITFNGETYFVPYEEKDDSGDNKYQKTFYNKEKGILQIEIKK